MGYRSDVGFACTPMVKQVIEQVCEGDLDLKDLFQCAKDCSSDDDGRWFWDYVKWYEDYPDIQIMENLMVALDSSELYEEYGMIRIGEEQDDIETKGTPYEFDMYVNRSIDI